MIFTLTHGNHSFDCDTGEIKTESTLFTVPDESSLVFTDKDGFPFGSPAYKMTYTKRTTFEKTVKSVICRVCGAEVEISKKEIPINREI